MSDQIMYEDDELINTQEDKEYEKDLQTVLVDITGYYYKVDPKTKKIRLQEGENPKFCKNMAVQIIGLLVKSMTRYTRYTKNESRVVGLKSIENIKSLWLLYYSSFSHKCGIGKKLPGWCTRQYSESQINVYLIDPAWRLVDDSYRHSIGGFTRKERNKTYSVNENRTVSVKRDKDKKSWFSGLTGDQQQEEEEEQ